MESDKVRPTRPKNPYNSFRHLDNPKLRPFRPRIEHLICLNRGCGTGADWFLTELDLLARTIAEVIPDRGTSSHGKLKVETWWGDQDGMVPKRGQGALLHLRSPSLLPALRADPYRLAKNG